MHLNHHDHDTQGHSRDCTEGFYRRHVEEEMKLRDKERQQGGGSAEGNAIKQSTIEALRRVRLEEKGTGAAWLVEDDRLEELVNRGDELSLEELTEEERRTFMAAIASGELGKDVEVRK